MKNEYLLVSAERRNQMRMRVGALAGAIFVCALAGTASAQTIPYIALSGFGTNVGTALTVATEASGGFPRVNGSPTVGNCLKWSATGIQDSGGVCSGGGTGNVSNSGTPTAGQLAEWTNATTIKGVTPGGDCTFSDPNFTCLKTNGVAFGALATLAAGTSSQVLRGDGTWGVVPQAALLVPVNAQTANYTAVAGDQEKLITASGTITISLTSAATLGSSWATNVLNVGVGNVTVHSLGGTINASSTDFILRSGDAMVVVSDGTNWQAMTHRAASPSPTYTTGNWRLPRAPGNTSTGGVEANGTAMCYPGTLTEILTVSQLGVYIATAGTTNLQLAVYNNSATGKPGTEIDATASIADNSTGAKSGALGANHQLLPGVYWWCVNQNDATVKYNVFDGTTMINSDEIGSSAIGDVLGTTHMTGLSTALAFGTWGDLTAATFSTVTSNLVPPIAFKANSVP